ncbi:hypothetical protein FACS18947_4070 [Bacteroidia bacterium]|nr:hypothetical protein FACS18947_4070 [Bacteroidia bacterium]
MQFYEKFSDILSALNITVSALARETGIHVSMIAKYRTGSRPIQQKSGHVKKLCDGFAKLLPKGVDAGVLPEQVRALTGVGHIKPAKLSASLFTWLNASAVPEFKIQSGRATFKAFGDKLSALMKAASVSNLALSRALHVDRTMISRYCTGARLPSVKGGTIEKICAYFSDRTLSQQQKQDILEMMGMRSHPKAVTREQLRDALSSWLAESQETEEDVSGVQIFLEAIDQFGTFAANTGLVPVEKIAELAGDIDEDISFFGYEGMRSAICRLLYGLVVQEKPGVFLAFSDQSVKWMFDLPEFISVWTSLLAHLLTRGHTIRIVHTVNRENSEMISALASWIPLYMMGNIEPYYVRSGERGLFRVNNYVVEGRSAVTSYCVADTEADAEYRYTVDSALVETATQQFSALLGHCGELMRIYRQQTGMKGFDVHLDAFWRGEGELAALSPTLSLATMPEELLVAILVRAGVSEGTKENVLEVYHAQETRLLRHLAKGKLQEFSVLGSEERLAAGEIALDIPRDILNTPIYYEPREYAEHLENMRKMEKGNPNYRFYALTVSPFHNISVLYRKGGEAIVIKSEQPAAAFAINNPYMGRGFQSFFDVMRNESAETDN